MLSASLNKTFLSLSLLLLLLLLFSSYYFYCFIIIIIIIINIIIIISIIIIIILNMINVGSAYYYQTTAFHWNLRQDKREYLEQVVIVHACHGNILQLSTEVDLCPE